VVGSFYRHLWDVERTNPGRKRVPGHYVRLVSSFVPQTALHHFGFSHLALHTWHKARNGCRRRTCWPFAFKRVRKRGQSRCRKLISTRVSTRNAICTRPTLFSLCAGVFFPKNTSNVRKWVFCGTKDHACTLGSTWGRLGVNLGSTCTAPPCGHICFPPTGNGPHTRVGAVQVDSTLTPGFHS